MLQWSYVSDTTITLPQTVTKNKREHTFPIGEYTRSIFATIPHTSTYLFPAGRSCFSAWSTNKIRFDEQTALPPYQIHDLRRTFSSLHAQLGTPIHLTERLLNHVSRTMAGVGGIYNRYDYKPELRQVVDNYEKHVYSLVF